MKNNKLTKFKRTEIGMIPSDWDIINFNETFNVLNNNTYSRDALNYIDGEYKNIHYGDILILFNEFVDLINKKVPYINNNLRVNSIRLEDGDVIFADTAEDETAGKAVEIINTKGIKAVSGLHTILCRKTKDVFSKYYLGYFFNSKVFHNQLLRYMTGSKVLSISKSDIKKTMVLLPPKLEQEKIANALTRIDNLIEDYEKLINKKEKIKQGLMQNLLTGKVRLKGYKGKMFEHNFSQIFESISTSGKKIQTSEYKKRGTYSVVDQGQDEIVGYSNDTEKVIDLNEAIIFGDHTRIFKYITRKFIVGADGVRVLKTKEKFDTHYIYYLLLTQVIPNTGYNRHFKYVKDLVLKVPKYNEQQAISQVLSNADNEINDLKIKFNKLINVKKGMLDSLLTGKIRL